LRKFELFSDVSHSKRTNFAKKDGEKRQQQHSIMIRQRNDENTISGLRPSLLSNKSARKHGKTPMRQVLGKKGKASAKKTGGRRALGSISINTGRRHNKSVLKKKIPLRTSTNTQQKVQQLPSITTEDIECSSTTTASSAHESYDGGINRSAAFGALQMGVRANNNNSDDGGSSNSSSAGLMQDLVDVQQCAALGGDRGFDGMDDGEIEITACGAMAMPMVMRDENVCSSFGVGRMDDLNDLSFGDISSDESEEEDSDDEE